MSKEEPVIMAVVAHPDDEIFLAGGSLARIREDHGNKVKIFIRTVCNGNKGSLELDSKKLRNSRLGEAQGSSAVIGADYDTCDISDLCAELHKHIAADILVGQFRQIRPDIVLTQFLDDRYMSDHGAIWWIVTHALFSAMVPNYNPRKIEFPPGSMGELGDYLCSLLHIQKDIRTRKERENGLTGYVYNLDNERKNKFSLPALYYGDIFPGHGILGEEDVPKYSFGVDIASTIGVKRKMLGEHITQGAWLKVGHGDSDYINTAMEWNKRKGALVGVECAEMFVKHKGAVYNQEPLFERLLGEYVRIVK